MDINHKHKPYYNRHMFQNVTHSGVCKAKGIRLHWTLIRSHGTCFCCRNLLQSSRFGDWISMQGRKGYSASESITHFPSLLLQPQCQACACVCWYGCKSRTEVWERGYAPDLLKPLSRAFQCVWYKVQGYWFKTLSVHYFTTTVR